jgi:hypothetical protein
MTTKKKHQHDAGKDAGKPKYQPTPSDLSALEAHVTRRKAAKPAPRLKVSKREGVLRVSQEHPDQTLGQFLLMEALGTTDPDFVNGLLKQLVNAGTDGREIDEAEVNFMLSVVKGIEPKDQIEALLAAQMAAVHMAAMTFARRLAHVENIQQQDSAERAFNKLTRTFAGQTEALRRYRTGGEHKVTVEHVTAKDAQAAEEIRPRGWKPQIVGSNVTHGGNGAVERAATPKALTDGRTSPVPMVTEGDRTPARARKR